ncbi:hypothetical protein ACEK07_04495 [Alcanivoracaceae bacterium MT1]
MNTAQSLIHNAQRAFQRAPLKRTPSDAFRESGRLLTRYTQRLPDTKEGLTVRQRINELADSYLRRCHRARLEDQE